MRGPRFELAEANLRKVERTNEKFAKTLSAAVISEYVEDLAIAKAQYDTVKRGELDQYPTWVRGAQSNWKTAQANYNNAELVNKSQSGSVDPHRPGTAAAAGRDYEVAIRTRPGAGQCAGREAPAVASLGAQRRSRRG